MGMPRYRIWEYSIRGATNAFRRFFYANSGYIGDIQRKCYSQEKDEDSRTEIIQSVSEIGDMVDFLKANPFVSMEDYKWKLSVPMIRIMSDDNTRVNYLSEAEAKSRRAKVFDGSDASSLKGLNIPTF